MSVSQLVFVALGVVVAALGTITSIVLACSKRREERRQADVEATRIAEVLYVRGDTKRKRAESMSFLASLDDEPSRDDLLWEAVESLRQAIAQFPSQTAKAPAYLSLGKCYESLGLEEDAMEEFSNTIRCDRNLTEAFERRGFAYLRAGNRTAACKDFDIVLQRDSKNLDIRAAFDGNCQQVNGTNGCSDNGSRFSKLKDQFFEAVRGAYDQAVRRRSAVQS